MIRQRVIAKLRLEPPMILCVPAVARHALLALVCVAVAAGVRTAEAQDELRALVPDVMIVAAYGLILPPEVLAIPTHGCLNIHASLLPRWRGCGRWRRRSVLSSTR